LPVAGRFVAATTRRFLGAGGRRRISKVRKKVNSGVRSNRAHANRLCGVLNMPGMMSGPR
jgi:hypothetical protein